jgi:hypothetical protein
MRNILKTILVASALVTGGAAFANDSTDSSFAQAIGQSQLAFAAQTSQRSGVTYRETMGSVPVASTPRTAASRGYAPADTMVQSNSSNN